MATLNDTDFTRIKEWVSSQPTIKTELKAWGLSRSIWQAAIQAIETYMVDGFGTRPSVSIRAAVESVTGATTSVRVQYIFVIWVSWKLKNFLGN